MVKRVLVALWFFLFVFFFFFFFVLFCLFFFCFFFLGGGGCKVFAVCGFFILHSSLCPCRLCSIIVNLAWHLLYYVGAMLRYCNDPKYWKTLSTCNTCLKIWNSPFYDLLLDLSKILLYAWQTVWTLIRRRVLRRLICLQRPTCPYTVGYYGTTYSICSRVVFIFGTAERNCRLCQ